MNIAVLLAGGSGTRLKSEIPKQYIKVNNKMIITYTVDTLIQSLCVSKIIIVADVIYHKTILDEIANTSKIVGFARPGDNRQESIYNALVFARENIDEIDYVMIQDAARPGTSLELIEACYRGAVNHDGAMPALPMKDTVYLSETGKKVSELLDRSKIFAGQAPEVFDFQKYLKANEALLPDRIYSINGSTEVGILAGMDIAMIPGDENNFKITTENDLKRFEDIVLCRHGF